MITLPKHQSIFRLVALDFQCDSGRFLDVRSTQECQPCPSGTFSLGGGIRYDSFSVLPRGFQVSTQESFDVVFSDDRGNSADDFQASVNCSEWVITSYKIGQAASSN